MTVTMMKTVHTLFAIPVVISAISLCIFLVVHFEHQNHQICFIFYAIGTQQLTGGEEVIKDSSKLNLTFVNTFSPDGIN